MIKDLVAEAERLEITEQAAFLVAQCVFTDNILKEIDENKTLFSKVSHPLLFINKILSSSPPNSYVSKMQKAKSIYYMLSKH